MLEEQVRTTILYDPLVCQAHLAARLFSLFSGMLSAGYLSLPICSLESTFLSNPVLSLGRHKVGYLVYHHPHEDLKICTASNRTSYPVCHENHSPPASAVRVSG